MCVLLTKPQTISDVKLEIVTYLDYLCGKLHFTERGFLFET
jgi:hypothetical protein